MVFTTLEYIAFFAAVFFLYYALPHKFRWMLLLGASWFFYAYASPVCLCFLAVTVLSTYAFARLIDRNLTLQKSWIKENGKTVDRDAKKAYKAKMEKRRKLYVAGASLLLLGMLGIFKYADFILNSFASLLSVFGISVLESQPSSLNLILPIGLSFYVFQSLGYVIDVEREMIACERNIFKHALFVSYFPQILQGPIGSYDRLAPQFFAEHRFNYEEAVFGIQRVAWGFFKKVMIANIIADRINPVWNAIGDYPGLICWSAILFLYAIQLYADFSGYMDIACGCSQMLGIKLDENFQSPYFSKSIAEFWRNWHITLGVWFKNYVFYPVLRSDWLQRIRRGLKGADYLANAIPTTIALLIVWFLIGLWHGADWSYVVYGLFHGSFVILAALMAPVYDRLHSRFPRFFGSKVYVGFQILRTFVIVCLGYAIFKPADLDKTYDIFRQMCSAIDGGGVYQLQYTLHHSFIKVFGWIALMFVVDVVHCKYEKGWILARLRQIPRPVRWLIYLTGLWLMVFFGLYGSGFDQFEYFKF